MFFRKLFNLESVIFLVVLLKLVFSIAAPQDLDVTPEYYEEAARNWTYVFDFGIVVCSFLAFSKMVRPYFLVYEAFLLSVLSFLVSTMLHSGDLFSALSSVSRLYTPLLLFSVLVVLHKDCPDSLLAKIKILFFAVTCLIVIGFVFLPMMANRNEGDFINLWWPAYFLDLHTTSYVATALAYMAFVIIGSSLQKWFRVFSAVAIPIIFIIAFGWGIRTATLSIIFFYMAVLIPLLVKKANVDLYYLALAIIFVMSAFYAGSNFESVSQFSSGRLDMYVAKIDQLGMNDIFSWLIGNGVGSDLIYTDIWWWAPKGAHNDFLTYLVEGGIFFLAVLLYVIYTLYKSTECYYARMMFISIVLPSFFSNGFLMRPVALYVAVFPLAYLYVMAIRNDDME